MAERAIGDILATGDRDFLVRNSGEQVKISSIQASSVALYFSALWCPPCRRFTPKLVQVYEQLTTQDRSLEVVFVSCDRDEESFNAYFAKMPWLAVPFSDSDCLQRLNKRYKVNGIPNLVILSGETGEIYTKEGVKFISDYGVGASPFTLERINELKEQEKAAKDNQTVHSVLGTHTRDYLISSTGDKVPISELEGKYVALFFVVRPIDEFTAVLTKIYEKLKEVGEKFEVVAVYFNNDESVFNESFASMPWLAIPHGDEVCDKLVRYFELRTLPTLVLIGPDGKTLNNNIADVIEEHGLEAWEGFPFSAEKLETFTEKSKAKEASQTLESLLVKDHLNFVIGKDGAKDYPEDNGARSLMHARPLPAPDHE
ncbi:probable nucleoredoxin 1-2 [Panicum virgatum]|uniref:probable nucleoredoxin 1-2 n=1 Tax=Panicum virgatum TaxID=38727 RepID=UPI0019D6330E|nr:probable nucleoredoxin 1-2 [Panicum virgatum]